MFRKPKRKAKASLRRQDDEEKGDALQHPFQDASTRTDDDEDEDESGNLLSKARKRTKSKQTNAAASTTTRIESSSSSSVMHSYDVSTTKMISNADLATRAAEHHSVATATQQHKQSSVGFGKAERGADGIFRDSTRNKFAAGPIRAQTNIRVTARFDYQPDICKDYKDTGFCGFGDSCIYLHDRGDTLTGWQLEQQWEEEQKQKKQDQALQAFVDLHASSTGGGTTARTTATTSSQGVVVAVTSDDGLPFACYLCRQAFKDPVVTNCQHYYCQACIMQHVRTVSEACPICNKDTASVFNQPTRLLAKKRRVVGAQASWQEYLEVFTAGTTTNK